MPMMQQQGGSPWIILDHIEQLFDVKTVERDAKEIPEDISVLMVVHPKNLSEATLYAIDQVVLGGGRALVFVDPHSEADRGSRGAAEHLDELVVAPATRDGSLGQKDGYPGMVQDLLASGGHLDRVFAIGCTFMMYEMAETTRGFGVKTSVSLNPIMIDGTGMCGACRVLVGDETKFACVDGPDFDAHQVDWDLLLSRRKAYLGPETDSADRAASS